MASTTKRTKPATESADDFKFEEALKRLETIVKELEEGSFTLEASIQKYEEGVALSRKLSSRLEQAQRRVDLLMKNASGELTAQPFDTDEDADADQ